MAGRFVKSLDQYVHLKNHDSTRELVIILVKKYCAELTLPYWKSVLSAVSELVQYHLDQQKIPKTFELYDLVKRPLQKLLESEAFLLEEKEEAVRIVLDFWVQNGDIFAGFAPKTEKHSLFQTATDFYIRSFELVLCPPYIILTRKKQKIRDDFQKELDQQHLALKHKINRLEILYHWHVCSPQVICHFDYVTKSLEDKSASETLDAIDVLINAEMCEMLTQQTKFFQPSDYHLLRTKLHPSLEPILSEFVTCLGTCVQKSKNNEEMMENLIKQTMRFTERLADIPEQEDIIVKCLTILSTHTSDPRVMDCLAISFERKLKSTNQCEKSTEDYPATWYFYRSHMSNLRSEVRIALSQVNHLPEGEMTGSTPSDFADQLHAVPVIISEAQVSLASGVKQLAKTMLSDGMIILGPPPVPFAFIATGSLTRGEMSLHSDIDCSLLADSNTENSQEWVEINDPDQVYYWNRISNATRLSTTDKETPTELGTLPESFKPYFNSLMELFEFKLGILGSWLTLDNLATKYVTKNNEFGFNTPERLSKAVIEQLNTEAPNVESFALMWPTVLYFSDKGDNLFPEFKKRIQQYFSTTTATTTETTIMTTTRFTSPLPPSSQLGTSSSQLETLIPRTVTTATTTTTTTVTTTTILTTPSTETTMILTDTTTVATITTTTTTTISTTTGEKNKND